MISSRRGTLPDLFAALAAAYGIGYLPYIASPVVIGALMDTLGFDEARAGTVATIELLAFAGTQLILALFIHRLPLVRLACFAAVVVVIGHVTAAAAAEFSSLAIGRLIAGVGEGMAAAAGFAMIAASANPQRWFAAAYAMGTALSAAVLATLPLIVSRWAYAGAYLCLAAIAVAMLILLAYCGRRGAAASRAAPAGAASWKLLVLPTVIAMGLVGISDGAIWTFTERIAVDSGLDSRTAGVVLGGSLLGGVGGALLSVFVGQRFGKTVPLVVGLLAWLACCVAITSSAGASMYVFAQLLYLFTFGFVIPYLYGVNGELDPGGRVMVAASSCYLLGLAIGPWAGGSVVVTTGYAMVGWIIAALLIGVLLIFVRALTRVVHDRHGL